MPVRPIHHRRDADASINLLHPAHLFRDHGSSQVMTRSPTSPENPVTANPEWPRLSKRMGELGLCSRREADRWITSGWVKVDGQVVDTLGTRVSPQSRI